MGFFDSLFGRQKPVPVGPERLFAMSTAQLTLETEQHLTPTGNAAICFKGVASGPSRIFRPSWSNCSNWRAATIS